MTRPLDDLLDAVVEIDGVQVDVRGGTFSLEDEVDTQPVCSFEVWDPTISIGRGMKVDVWEQQGGPHVFAGFVESSDEARPVPSVSTWKVDAVGERWLAEKRVAAEVYEETTVGAIVRDLVDTYLSEEGVSKGTIVDGPSVARAVISYRPIAEALDELAELADVIWRIRDRTLDFQPRGAETSPWTVTADDVDGDSVDLRREAPQYRNRQWIRGGLDITDEQVETFTGDGERRNFLLSFPVARKPTVEVNGSAKAVAIKGLSDGEWYWNKGDNTVSQDKSLAELTSSDTLTVTYKGQFPLVVIAEDTDEIESRKQVEGGSGQHEWVDEDASLDSRGAALTKAENKIDRLGVIGRQLRFVTERSGLEAGQVATVHLADLGLDQVDMLVERVRSRDVGAGHLEYECSLVEGPAESSWVKYWRRLQQRTGSIDAINVGTDDVLARLASFVAATDWTEQLDVTVNGCPVPATDLFPAEDLHPC